MKIKRKMCLIAQDRDHSNPKRNLATIITIKRFAHAEIQLQMKIIRELIFDEVIPKKC